MSVATEILKYFMLLPICAPMVLSNDIKFFNQNRFGLQYIFLLCILNVS